MDLEFRGETGAELATLAYILKHNQARHTGIVCAVAMVDTVLFCRLL